VKHSVRHQQGHIYEASGAFFVRYSVNEIIDGKPRRVQRSTRLCTKDGNKYRTVKDIPYLKSEMWAPRLIYLRPGPHA